jgi:hypothetical protein
MFNPSSESKGAGKVLFVRSDGASRAKLELFDSFQSYILCYSSTLYLEAHTATLSYDSQNLSQTLQFAPTTVHSLEGFYTLLSASAAASTLTFAVSHATNSNISVLTPASSTPFIYGESQLEQISVSNSQSGLNTFSFKIPLDSLHPIDSARMH